MGYGYALGAIAFGIITILYATSSGSVIATRLIIGGIIAIGIGAVLGWQTYTWNNPPK